MKKRMFSGIQPTGNLHLGNYLGAIRQWASLQAKYDSIFSVVDLHAITSLQEPDKLRSKTLEMAGLLIACGIDPATSTMFVQSHISGHSELAWVLECATPVGWLRRMTQFKEKAAESESVSTGVLAYPALMAADILLYHADVVPVGDDQTQHLEMTRDLVKRFNSLYGETFTMPELIVVDKGGRIMALDNPVRKMSKSADRPGHAIYLLDSAEDIRGKIGRATTDSQKEIRFDVAGPGIHNLLTIYEVLTGSAQDEIESRFQGKGYAHLKSELAEVIAGTLSPIQERYRDVADESGYIESILEQGASRLRPIAQETLRLVYSRVGLR